MTARATESVPAVTVFVTMVGLVLIVPSRHAIETVLTEERASMEYVNATQDSADQIARRWLVPNARMGLA